MRIGSLFAGIGGLELGLEWAGVGHTVWQVEQEPFCREVLARHWPDAVRYDDVRTVGAANLAPVDLICGGFPCQDISTAGKGAGLAGARSGLWFEYARIIGEIRPRFVVVENVAALIGRGLDRVLADLAACGYDAVWFPVRAADVGAPHRRERIFIVGMANDHGGGRGERADGGEPEPAGRPASRVTAGGGELRELDDPDARGLRRAGASGSEGHAALADQGVADAAAPRRVGSDGHQRPRSPVLPERQRGAGHEGAQPQPRVGGVADGLPPWLDRWPARPGEAQHEWEAPRVAAGVENRAARLRSLGNAVVPQVAYVIGRVVMELEHAQHVARRGTP